MMKWIPAEANNSFTDRPLNKYFKVESYEMTDRAGQNHGTLAVSEGLTCLAHTCARYSAKLRGLWTMEHMEDVPKRGDTKLTSK